MRALDLQSVYPHPVISQLPPGNLFIPAERRLISTQDEVYHILRHQPIIREGEIRKEELKGKGGQASPASFYI